MTHPDQIVDQGWIGIVFRPHKHHADLGFRSLPFKCRHQRRVFDFPLQNPFVRIFQGGDFLASWFHIHAVSGKGVQRL
ncbi:MAG: hypothetical protein DMF33_12430 [Verrucomicrobia bacterium]|nr:MAG: hypothetical protein DMF33_12430 [Verrucomicrobiota bacterium]